jgi:hypothetical protein
MARAPRLNLPPPPKGIAAPSPAGRAVVTDTDIVDPREGAPGAVDPNIDPRAPDPLGPLPFAGAGAGAGSSPEGASHHVGASDRIGAGEPATPVESTEYPSAASTDIAAEASWSAEEEGARRGAVRPDRRIPALTAAVVVLFAMGAVIGSVAARNTGHPLRRFALTEAVLIAWHDHIARIGSEEETAAAGRRSPSATGAEPAGIGATPGANVSATAASTESPPGTASAAAGTSSNDLASASVASSSSAALGRKTLIAKPPKKPVGKPPVKPAPKPSATPAKKKVQGAK